MEIRKGLRKGKQVYTKLFISYLAILCIPLLFGMFIYVQSYRENQEQAYSLNSSLMQIIKNECDNQMNHVVEILNRLAFDTNVQKLSSVKELDAKERYNSYMLYQDLKNSSFAGGDYQDVFVYFQNTNTVVSMMGSMSLEMFYHLTYENSEMNYQEFREYLSGSHFYSILPIQIGEKKSILCTLTSMNSDLGENSATIGIRMGVEVLDEKVKTEKWDERISFAIVDEENRIINTMEEEIPADAISYTRLSADTEMELQIDGEKVIGKVLDSEIMNWKYLCLMPEKVILSRAENIQKNAFIGLFLCTLTGFLISYYFTNKNYNPIKALMELFRREEKSNDSEVKDEYLWLEDQAKQFFQEHMDIQQKLKQMFLFQMLCCPYENIDHSLAQKYTESLKSPYNLVLVFFSGASEEKELEESLRSFIVTNVAGELLSEHFNIETVDMGDRAAMIVNLPSEDEIYLNIVRESLQEAERTIRDMFQFQMYCLAGGIHEGREGVHSSWLEAGETEEYVKLLEEAIIFYPDIKNTSQRYHYPLEEENKIINALKTGDALSAENLLNKVMEENYRSKGISASMFKCLMYDMMGTIMKGADAAGQSNFFETHEIKLKGRLNVPLEDIKKEFSDLIEQLCQESQQMIGGNENNLSEEIMKYVQESYQDPDLNISQTAFHFERTPSYISSVFKRQTGKSLLKYINAVRIEEAESLLQEGYSVTETAERVGYRESRTFIRIFKENTGITPGQMKKKK